MVTQKDGHQGGDELVPQGVPGSVDLQQSQDQHVRTVLDGIAEELFDRLVLAHLSQP